VKPILIGSTSLVGVSTLDRRLLVIFILSLEHKNLVGLHPDLGPICISLRKEADVAKA
jgi:hypothetical protein